ncbi:MAG: biopolymer transporter ExbD [Candidatus Krumholzibacteriota bacterium]|nr:biopolymer transporter ExbD [Candidatus Krumholzibacteriota bacterium]
MSALSFRDGRRRPPVTLNMTPLIDVLFLFIIFFMLTGTFKRVGELELQLPDSETATPAAGEEAAHQLDLVATEDGRLLLDGSAVALPGLKAALAAALREDPASRVMIKAEAGVTHGRVVVLLDIVRGAGFRGAGIGTYTKAPAAAP